MGDGGAAVCCLSVGVVIAPVHSAAERLLRRVHDVEEAVLVLLGRVQLLHGRAVRREALLVDEQEDRLLRVQLQTATAVIREFLE